MQGPGRRRAVLGLASPLVSPATSPLAKSSGRYSEFRFYPTRAILTAKNLGRNLLLGPSRYLEAHRDFCQRK